MSNRTKNKHVSDLSQNDRNYFSKILPNLKLVQIVHRKFLIGIPKHNERVNVGNNE